MVDGKPLGERGHSKPLPDLPKGRESEPIERSSRPFPPGVGTETERDIERFGARRVVGAFVVTPLTGFSLGFVSPWVLFWPAAVFRGSPWAFCWPVLATVLIVVTVFVALRKLLPARFRNRLPILLVLFVFAGFLGFVAFMGVAAAFGDLGR